MLAALVERRLLVADDGTVELVHEALLERWPRLVAWLEEDAQGRRLHRHLTLAASEWEAAGRDPSELYRGARLAATLDWADAARARTLNRVERRLPGREPEPRRAWSPAAARQPATARAARRAVVLLVAALVAGRRRAGRTRGRRSDQATAAIAQRLGAQALVEPRLDRALLLAREGVNLDDSVATRSNLLAALLRSPAALAVLRGGGRADPRRRAQPDGRRSPSRGDDGNVRFFDTRTLHEVGPRFARTGTISYCGAIVRPVRALAFSPDGRTLAVGDADAQGLATLFLVDTRHTSAPAPPSGDRTP